MIKIEQVIQALNKVRENSPLVHNITNYVVMNNTANALLAIGASPVMSHAVNEVEDMVEIASSLVINMGTLSEKWVDAMLLAGEKATKKGTPVIFDPVGVGATPYRTQVAKQIIETCKPTIIRGNASEIMALTNSNVITKGVDSTESSNTALDSAKLLAKSKNAIVVVSGETDFITNGTEIISITNGSPMMAKVTGMGCTATAMIGAFAGTGEDKLIATASAMAVMSIAGEIAAQKSAGPGSMQVNFLDTLYTLNENDIVNIFQHE
ncbi:hydroxyethylthiazole kinase [Labilibaculum filiforme]|uniref:Hydroxyethylthiazole kinase n=1 Tax=Labilibaculum filiforme TaxID=1940526 RepID=A0A2N3HVJ9_9BACT|nr:hydroxyethylthiazole kinase [Labilibaculum filiforme]PKQ62051.1 hydroxyethylthiazole kinase [Labilibaculum filiforme]